MWRFHFLFRVKSHGGFRRNRPTTRRWGWLRQAVRRFHPFRCQRGFLAWAMSMPHVLRTAAWSEVAGLFQLRSDFRGNRFRGKRGVEDPDARRLAGSKVEVTAPDRNKKLLGLPFDPVRGLASAAESFRAVALSRSSKNVMSGRNPPTANALIRAVSSGGILRATP